MGIRGELFSTKVSLQNRTYFFNVKENRLGDLYLNIVESKNRDEGGFDRQSVILFAEDLQEFLKGFDESLRVLEKAVREKRRGGGSGTRSKSVSAYPRSGEEKPETPAGEGKGDGKRRFKSRAEHGKDERPGRGRRENKEKDGASAPKKRMVVKKSKPE